MALNSNPLTSQPAPALAEALADDQRGAAAAQKPAPAPRRPFGRWFRETGWRHLIGIVMLLFCAFPRLSGFRPGARRFGLGFLPGRRALPVCFILLGLAFANQVVTANYGADDFLGLTLRPFDDTPDGFLGSGLVVLAHGYPSAGGSD